MKTTLTLLLAILLPLATHAADDLSTALQKGLFEEEANQNLPAAIKAYESLLATSDEQRKLAATALFRLGECYRKLGRTNDAVAQYQRLLRDYTEQETLATLSRQNLRGLGADRTMSTTTGDQGASSALTSEGRARLKELLQNEIKIAERFAAEQRKRIEAGTLPVGETVRYERDVLGLKRQLVAVDGLSSEADRNEWRNLLMQEIKLAEDAVRVEQQKLEVGRSVASEVARLQRDVLILKRELVTFESAPRTVAQSQAAPVSSIESEELARTERILAQLSGWDLGQVRRLLPTLVPDADFESYDRQLTEAQEKLRTSTAEERVKWERNADQNKARLQQRLDEVKRILQERIAQLRALVNEQLAEAKRTQRTVGSESAALTAAQVEARSVALLKQLQALGKSELVTVLPTVVSDPVLNSLLEQNAQAVRKQAELETTFAKDHPSVKANESALKQLHEQIDVRVDGIMKGLAIKAAALNQQAATGVGNATSGNEEDQEIRRIQALIKNSPDLINAVNVEIEKVRSGELMVPKNGTLLHKAANQGQLTVAKFLLEQGADVGARDELGRTPLHRAAGNGHKAMVELLLANKADANAKVSHSSDTGSTSLNLAMKKGYRSVCEALLERGADPNVGDGALPIYSAVFARDEASLRLLIAKGARVNPYLEMKSDTPLHNAPTPAIAKILIEAGAPVDALNAANQSPLHAKAREGNLDVLEILLAAGANPSLKDSVGQTPLHLAAFGWNANVITPLIAKGANPNERDSAGGTPLDALIRSGYGRNTDFARQIEALRALLAGGADPNLIQRGRSPHLYRAVADGLEEQAEMLLKAGADPNAKYIYSDGNGWQTSLIVALQGTKHPERAGQKTRSMDLVKLLLDYKADPNLSNGAGVSPLWFAMALGSRDFAERAPFVEVLLQRGANIEGRDSDGKTLLAIAVELGMKEMTEMLLKRKADPNAKTGNGKSPLHLAASSRNMELVDMLLAAGADPNALDSQGLSALDYVKQSVFQPTGIRNIRAGFAPSVSGQQPSQAKDTTQSDLAERLRKAGARDWAPRPGLITVTRRSTGASEVIFTKGTNDLNRYSLLEVIGFTFFGSSTSFPFPDFSKLTITRADGTVPGGIREFSMDLAAALAKDGCKADQWLEWGDLIDIPEGEHKLDELWLGLRTEDRQLFAQCLARKISISVKTKATFVNLSAPNNWSSPPGVISGSQLQAADTFWLHPTVKRSGLLLTSSDTASVKVTRPDSTGGSKVWTFDLTKEPSAGNDLWLRDGDVIEVPEK